MTEYNLPIKNFLIKRDQIVTELLCFDTFSNVIKPNTPPAQSKSVHYNFGFIRVQIKDLKR